MSEKTLFEVKEEHLDTGLRGIPTGHCPTSKVDPQKGLSYRGYPISDLAYKDPEEIIYLLYRGEFPTKEELIEFKNELISRSKLDPQVIDHLRSLPREGHPMKWFLSGINCMGLVSSKGDYREDFLNLISQLPEMVAAIFRIRSQWGDTILSKPELGYMENFAQMLSPPQGSQHLTKLMRIFNVLHYDHGGGNLSTFVGKAVASSLADIYESLMGAMTALAGPLHGKANQECLRFLKTTYSKISNPEEESAVLKFVEELFHSGGKLYGFGHAVLRVEDPRATVQYELGKEIAGEDPYFKLALLLRKVGSEFLGQQEKISNPYPNVDAVSGSLLNANGLKEEDYYTVLFGLSRCVGIGVQIVYERKEARHGKGTPIVRPKYIYSGPVR